MIKPPLADPRYYKNLKPCIYISQDEELGRAVIQTKGQAIHMYFYILLRMEKGQAMFTMDRKDFMDRFNIKSYVTYKLALDELIRIQFIIPTEKKNVFRINSKFAFA
jgi:hypothetical protein